MSMIKARHTYIGDWVARLYAEYRLEKAFNPIYIHNTAKDNGLPILLVANHFCWWDGFIQYRLNRHIFGRKLHVMMLEERLREFMILNQCGVFSINRQSREMVESLRYTVELLRDKRNMVLIFPQGELQSLYTPDFRFGSGIEYILKHLENNIQLIFNINLIDYYSNKYPSMTIYTRSFDYMENPAISIEEAFNGFAETCKLQQIPG